MDAAVDSASEVTWPVASRETEHVGAIAAEAPRVRRCVGLLCIGRAPAVLEIVDALRAHERVLDAAEIDPDMAVLMNEQGRVVQIGQAPAAAPLLIEISRPGRPRIVGD